MDSLANPILPFMINFSFKVDQMRSVRIADQEKERIDKRSVCGCLHLATAALFERQRTVAKTAHGKFRAESQDVRFSWTPHQGRKSPEKAA
jgi:hypothetical protein